MCPYTLDHNKMLASTMQHSTHNHTPTPEPPPQPPPGCVRPNRPGPAPRTHPQMSPQDPTACQARPPPHTGPVRTSSNIAFHPATPTPTAPTRSSCSIRRGNSARRPNPTRRPTKPQPTTDRASTPSTRWLLRKEVIQPHLPVRL